MALNEQIANKLIADLQRDFGLSLGAAQGVVGALAMESAGFQTMQEVNPTVAGSRGGYGYAQWTGPRRRAFENFASDRGLSPSSYDANYQYLSEELRGVGRHDGGLIRRLANVTDPQQAQILTTDVFLRPGIVHPAARADWTRQVVGSTGATGGTALDAINNFSAPAADNSSNRLAFSPPIPDGRPAAIAPPMPLPRIDRPETRSSGDINQTIAGLQQEPNLADALAQRFGQQRETANRRVRTENPAGTAGNTRLSDEGFAELSRKFASMPPLVPTAPVPAPPPRIAAYGAAAQTATPRPPVFSTAPPTNIAAYGSYAQPPLPTGGGVGAIGSTAGGQGRTPSRPAPAPPSLFQSAGYIYQENPQGGYQRVGRVAPGTPSQQYNEANRGPQSVSSGGNSGLAGLTALRQIFANNDQNGKRSKETSPNAPAKLFAPPTSPIRFIDGARQPRGTLF